MAIPDKANTRAEKYLASMAGESVALPDKPNTRRERYLAKAAGQVVETPEPITREEMYLDAIAEGGGGGGGGGISVVPLTATENKKYTAPSGTAYSPVTVNVPTTTPTLIPKTISANGIYAAEDDNADGFSAVTVNVPVGDTIYYTNRNVGYTAHTVATGTQFVGGNQFDGAAEMETAVLSNIEGQITQNLFIDCDKLREITCPKGTWPGIYFYKANSGHPSVLEKVQFGSVGNPSEPTSAVTNIAFGFAGGGTKPTITIYVDAETLADVPANWKQKQPWGAAGSTIVYRSATTGEVLV